MPGVLAGDHVHFTQDPRRADGEVLQVANRGGDNVQRACRHKQRLLVGQVLRRTQMAERRAQKARQASRGDFSARPRPESCPLHSAFCILRSTLARLAPSYLDRRGS